MVAVLEIKIRRTYNNKATTSANGKLASPGQETASQHAGLFIKAMPSAGHQAGLL
jgi:hypothetical protein